LWIAPALAQSDPQLPAGPPPPGYAKPATEKPEKYEYKFGSGSGALTCFATGTAAEILVNLERCQKMAEQHEVLKEANMELLAQIASLRKIVEVQSEEIAACGKAVDGLKEVIDEKDKACKEKVDDAKTGFWTWFTFGGSMIAVGLLLGLLL